MLEAIGVIPARYRSTRFPGKALAALSGKPLIQHVYDRSAGARSLSRVLVATDDERIAAAVRAFGGEAVLTSEEHRSGTDRLAEVARRVESPIYVNIQGDEPLVDSRDIDALVEDLRSNPSVDMATLRSPVSRREDRENPNVIKVVCGADRNALYFSRSPIPHRSDGEATGTFRHHGLYAYRREFLLRISAEPPGTLETMERLEQLRVLESGGKIRVLDALGNSIGVDTPEDLEKVRRLLGEGPS
ncbi:MAG TPA: 3-deoxy-manno-octulosonate cytidylyltransferase [Candidatus Polarisedimenticolia bacterium]|nr:3-deoxy-manno-octulosonate cytidylyltransferase [Candidatus Polarisedimenticolia bacterium]